MTAPRTVGGMCHAEEDDDATGSTWFCTLARQHAGEHETWTGGTLRYRWPRAPWELVEVRPRPRTWWRVARRWLPVRLVAEVEESTPWVHGWRPADHHDDHSANRDQPSE